MNPPAVAFDDWRLLSWAFVAAIRLSPTVLPPAVRRAMSDTPISALPTKRRPATSPLPVMKRRRWEGEARDSAAVASRKCVELGSCRGEKRSKMV